MFKKLLGIPIFWLTIFFVSSCSSEFEVEHEVGPMGEHPKSHKIYYQKTFIVLKHDFFKSLDAIYSFSEEARLYTYYHSCFNRIFDISIKAMKSKYWPCIISNAEIGPPNKVNIAYNVIKKDFNNSDGINYIEYEISISTHYKKNEIPSKFVKMVEPILTGLQSNYNTIVKSALEK